MKVIIILSFVSLLFFWEAGMAKEIAIPTKPEPLFKSMGEFIGYCENEGVDIKTLNMPMVSNYFTKIQSATSLADHLFGLSIDQGYPPESLDMMIICNVYQLPHGEEYWAALLSVIPDSIPRPKAAFIPWAIEFHNITRLADSLGGVWVMAPVSTADTYAYYSFNQTWSDFYNTVKTVNEFFWFVNPSPRGGVTGPHYVEHPPGICQWGISTTACDPLTHKPVSAYGPSAEYKDWWLGSGGNRVSFANGRGGGRFWVIKHLMEKWLGNQPGCQEIRLMVQELAGPGSSDSLGRWESHYGVIDITPSKIDSVLLARYGPAATPVELTNFSAKVVGRTVHLYWATASETNNLGFVVQRKQDKEIKWVRVGFVNGQGTTTVPQNYQFRDKPPMPGSYWYRLKQIDTSGAVQFFEPIKVEMVKLDLFAAQNYPNPFNPTTTIKYSLPDDANVTLKIYDLQGREIAVLVDEYQKTGEHSVVWNAGDQSAGVYFYRLQASGFTETGQMVLIK